MCDYTYPDLAGILQEIGSLEERLAACRAQAGIAVDKATTRAIKQLDDNYHIALTGWQIVALDRACAAIGGTPSKTLRGATAEVRRLFFDILPLLAEYPNLEVDMGGTIEFHNNNVTLAEGLVVTRKHIDDSVN